ncbi:ribosomal protein L13 domain-containing protein [Globomyces pollinis-pini]|nr:ribosomal protein L13 domain-containing protein [Globomyces pollinis-pini]
MNPIKNGLVHARVWHEVDAKNKTLGKLAARIGIALRGKYKPHYNPAFDYGDYVVVKNARHVALSGNKSTQKEYNWHTTYPGGLTTIKYDKFIENHPTGPLKKAIWGMLPKNRLRHIQMLRLYIYPDDHHPYEHNILKDHTISNVDNQQTTTTSDSQPR